ncbi:hypothetical protein AMATHDRAFT_70134 [Amanita thiersii Skay4041]|uniref:UBC core domain-containing protein n=1 Tax=Amanita thiersii Skay4041 TaxID=703135 RepID=A0A2A9NEY7_9AGAR|nr:hypothetical protein AMATHDRAFT_70134 [Amanita thiersii Skay4041]
MLAAERFLEGKFDHIREDGDNDFQMEGTSSESKKKTRPLTPDDGDDEMGSNDEDSEDDDADDYVDYDSDFAPQGNTSAKLVSEVDPYAGIFFSRDRREEVIEVEEEPEVVTLPDAKNARVTLMSQGQWMKGCPEGGEQSFLFGLYSQLSEGQCPCPQQCGSSMQRRKSDFFTIFTDFSSYVSRLRKVLRRKCEMCSCVFCFACGEPVATDKAKGSMEDNSLFHCSNIQGVILGVGLSMLEQYFAETVTPINNVEEQTRKRRKTEGHEADLPVVAIMLGTGAKVYSKKAKGGIGYAGEQVEDHSGQLEAQAVQRAKDEKIGKLLTAIRVYLPNLHREGGGQTSDYLVHPTALAHLRRRFNYVCSTLLRNDSLADMSDRSVLYFELLEWLETISNHEALASMMAMPIMVVASVKSVITRRSLNGRNIRERTIIYEGSAGPRELLEGIVIQAHAALKGLDRVRQLETPTGELTEEQKRMTAQDMKGKAKEIEAPLFEDNQRLIVFCRRILSTARAIDRSLRETKGDGFVDRLHAGLPKLPGVSQPSSGIAAGTTLESAMVAYVDWATRARFEYCDLTIPAPQRTTQNSEEDASPHYKFYFNNEARMLANSDIPKRSLAIAKELAILTTNLPVAWGSSIFLRVDETRVDIIKALIIGPEGTPFLFDIFLGSNYNQSPPSVKYMTTNGGKFRFNPNLYADGKVCLSLLGTWTGPGWVSGKSTLLQVLISIQSMILCEEPYLNEPGWANSGGSPQSRAYSANVRRMVVKTAMLGNLKNPPEPFGDVIHTHFRLKEQYIRAQLDKWLESDDGRTTVGDGGMGQTRNGEGNNGMKKDVDELKGLLIQLRTGNGALSTA